MLNTTVDALVVAACAVGVIVFHEIGHYFGMEETELEQIEKECSHV